MNIAWLFAENTILPPTTPVQAIKDLAPIWGSWRTQRSYQTDNAICWDPAQAEKLVRQGYAKICNLYISEKVYVQMDCPAGVQAFGGDINLAVDSVEDIIATWIVGSKADVILMVGFDLEAKPNPTKSRNDYIGILAHAMENSGKQWVVIDHHTDLAEPIQKLSNITRDLLPNVLQLLGNNNNGN
jgi:hypothetical protein